MQGWLRTLRSFRIQSLQTVNFRQLSTITEKAAAPRRSRPNKLDFVAACLICGQCLYFWSLDGRERRKIAGTFKGVDRFLRTVLTGGSVAADYKWSLHGMAEDSTPYDDAIHACHQRSADRLLKMCLRNGGLYIKMGQALSAAGQANMIPREYATTLQVLQDKALVMRPDDFRDLFVEDFGAEPDKFFSKVGDKPVAAASLAQVFRATTVDGKDVAVKCQYIDLQDRYAGDIRTVDFVLGVVEWLYPQFVGRFVFREIKDTLAMELDFINEGKNSERCAKDLKHLNFLHVPTVCWNLTSSRVLTTEFIDNAAKISEVDKIKQMGLSVADVNKKFLTIFGEQIFSTGFVHADPHPGNIFVKPDLNGKAQIVLLDHGLYETIPPNILINVCHLYKATVTGDHTKMKRYSDNLGMPDYRLFATVLVQRPVGNIGQKLIGIKKDMTREEMERMRKEMEKEFDIIATVRAMPRSLFLVMRNMNIVRSISVVHGNPNDRYTIFSRIAARTAASDPGNAVANTFIERTGAVMERLHFEWSLFIHRVTTQVFMFIMRLASLLGLLPTFPSGKTGFGPPGAGLEKDFKDLK